MHRFIELEINEERCQHVSYNLLIEDHVTEYKVKGSRFIAYAFGITCEKDFQEKLNLIRKEHNKARHHCWAYRLGELGNNERMSDDGEPSGTAGRPILGQLQSKDLTFTSVIVVRYFGGTLLGTSGLIQAYKHSTMQTLDSAKINTKKILKKLKLTFDMTHYGWLQNELKKVEGYVNNQDFNDRLVVDVLVPINNYNNFLASIASNHLISLVE